MRAAARQTAQAVSRASSLVSPSVCRPKATLILLDADVLDRGR